MCCFWDLLAYFTLSDRLSGFLTQQVWGWMVKLKSVSKKKRFNRVSSWFNKGQLGLGGFFSLNKWNHHLKPAFYIYLSLCFEAFECDKYAKRNQILFHSTVDPWRVAFTSSRVLDLLRCCSEDTVKRTERSQVWCSVSVAVTSACRKRWDKNKDRIS